MHKIVMCLYYLLTIYINSYKHLIDLTLNLSLQMEIVLCLTQSASKIVATNISRLFLECPVVKYVENRVWLPRRLHRATSMTPSLNT